jgi:hypothetical protein
MFFDIDFVLFDVPFYSHKLIYTNIYTKQNEIFDNSNDWQLAAAELAGNEFMP